MGNTYDYQNGQLVDGFGRLFSDSELRWYKQPIAARRTSKWMLAAGPCPVPFALVRSPKGCGQPVGERRPLIWSDQFHFLGFNSRTIAVQQRRGGTSSCRELSRVAQ